MENYTLHLFLVSLSIVLFSGCGSNADCSGKDIYTGACMSGLTCVTEQEDYEKSRNCFKKLGKTNTEFLLNTMSDFYSHKVKSLPEMFKLICDGEDQKAPKAWSHYFCEHDKNEKNESEQQKKDYEKFKDCIKGPIKQCVKMLYK